MLVITVQNLGFLGYILKFASVIKKIQKVEMFTISYNETMRE